MAVSFETMGNAIVAIYQDGNPILATDPWLTGTAYFGSWALEKPLTEQQIKSIQAMKYIWFSHGHPDHFHPESIALLPKDIMMLVGDLYHNDIRDYLVSEGYTVRVLKYREWFALGNGIRICCMDNMNQDAILVVETPDGLLINKNDSPFMGEFSFLWSLVRKWPREKTWITALCAIDADMKNIVDESGNRVTPPPEKLKVGMIRKTARDCENLGIGHFCASSSQHIYVRRDSAWANDYRIRWGDIQKHWSRPSVDIHEPFITCDMSKGNAKPNHPGQPLDLTSVPKDTGSDDWSARLNEAEWQQVSAFFQQYETLESVLDFVAFTVGGERRDIPLGKADPAKPDARGIHFRVPAQSLMECAHWGYFDDLLIGNFMMTELINTQLYPDFTPRVAKYGGNAKIYTNKAIAAFRWHYIARNPWAYIRWRSSEFLRWTILPAGRKFGEFTRLRPILKRIYRQMIGEPV